ncbi:AAA family ATPase [Pseudovibrio axinellae]|nr:MoxR family ATPase [Pseudovibrio axinellae]
MSISLNYQKLLAEAGYIAGKRLSLAISMAETLERPLLLEGEAGAGKTFVAQSLAKALGRDLIRLQCYEGLDAQQSIYEWNYQRQMLAIALAGKQNNSLEDADLFSSDNLIRRPLLDSISRQQAPVLLIDEVDRADEEFEAFLLEILSEYQVTIPELGAIQAVSKPLVIITSNGVRDISDALRRRCLFQYVEYPDYATELRIIQVHLPQCSLKLASSVAAFVAQLRKEDLNKNPGVAETLDWAAALMGLQITDVAESLEQAYDALFCLLKTKEDQDQIPFSVFERLVARSI